MTENPNRPILKTVVANYTGIWTLDSTAFLVFIAYFFALVCSPFLVFPDFAYVTSAKKSYG